jgi:hypothetical protein
MSDKRFYQEKSAYLTALISALITAKRVCETLDRHEAGSPTGPSSDLTAVKELLDDTIFSAEALRNTVDRQT